MIYILSIIIIFFSFLIVSNNPALNGLSSSRALYFEAGVLMGYAFPIVIAASIIIHFVIEEESKKLDKKYITLIMSLCFFLAVIWMSGQGLTIIGATFLQVVQALNNKNLWFLGIIIPLLFIFYAIIPDFRKATFPVTLSKPINNNEADDAKKCPKCDSKMVREKGLSSYKIHSSTFEKKSEIEYICKMCGNIWKEKQNNIC